MITVGRKPLVDMMKLVATGMSSKSTLPILQYVKLKLKEGDLEFTATDLDIRVVGTIGCNNLEKQEAEICIPAKRLLSVLSLLNVPEVEINFVPDGKSITVVAGKGKFNIFGLEPGEYPFGFETGIMAKYVFNAKTLIDTIGRVSYCVGQSETREILNSLHLFEEDKQITFVATDGRRLAKDAIEVGDKETENKIFIPAKALNAIVSCISHDQNEGSKEVEVCCSGGIGQVTNSTGSASVTFRMNEGEFPDYKDVMTDTSGEKFTVLDVERVSSAAKRVSNFAGSDGTGILMKISGNKITFNARSSDVGTAEEEIEIQNNGVEEIEFLLNFKYLIDAVTNSGTKEVKLFTIADRRPLTFVADKGNYVAVVMPMRKEGV